MKQQYTALVVDASDESLEIMHKRVDMRRPACSTAAMSAV
jgi:hypothetical protein